MEQFDWSIGGLYFLLMNPVLRIFFLNFLICFTVGEWVG